MPKQVSAAADRGRSGQYVEFRTVRGDNDAEMDALAASIEALRESGHRYRDQAVLCSGNDRLSKIGTGLEARGIPVLYLGSLFERPEVPDLLAWLSLLVDRRAMGLARRTTVPGLAMSLSDVAAVLTHAKNQMAAPLDWCRGAPRPKSLRKATVRWLTTERLARDWDPDPWTALAILLLDRAGIAARIASTTDVAAVHRAIGIRLVATDVVIAHPGSNEQPDLPIGVDFRGEPALTQAQLALYERCPGASSIPTCSKPAAGARRPCSWTCMRWCGR
jgi:hypothetical protein